ncbi:MAG: 6-phosphogluconolactonase [Pyrinomonadaceae bacterium]
MSTPRIIVKKDPNDLSLSAAELFASAAIEAIAARGRYAVSLSGGSTPRSLYARLAAEYGSLIDWSRVHFFFGDERFVPADSPESNFRMVDEALFAPLGIAAHNIHRWRTELGDPAAAAADYEVHLKQFFDLAPGALPRFDLTLLGLGEDGHTASIFPGTPAVHETERLAIANWVDKLQMHRLTLTLPVINNSTQTVFIVAGTGKADIVRRIIDGPPTADLPASLVSATGNPLIWLLDAAAGARLDR